MMLYDYLDTV